MDILDVNPAVQASSRQGDAAPTDADAKPVPIVIPQSQEAPCTAKQRRLEALDVADLPASYSSRSAREAALLEYVEHWRRQWARLFPGRADLLLTPLNECGLRRFVCTTIRPTLLRYPALHDLHAAAAFVADFLQYVPMDPPTALPDFLPSPTTTIRSRQGDCLDLATLLVSILRGAGHRAHVVAGYAPAWVTLQDQTAVDCPLLASTAWTDDPPRALADLCADPAPPATTSPATQRYDVHRDREQRSRYLALVAEREAAEAAQLADEAARRNASRFEYDDPLKGRRVHCWVLVLDGRRDALFVEPSTGVAYRPAQAPYERIESVWNEANYWANLQQGVPVGAMTFDLDDAGAWEYVLVKGDGPRDDGKRALLDVPPWPAKVDIPYDLFEAVYPDRCKTTFYHRCKAEKFSRHSDGRMGLVLRLTLFDDDARQAVAEVREVFDGRRDGLVLRVTNPDKGAVKLRYAPGKASGIQDLIEVAGTTRVMRFYPGSRVDGLVRRTETVNRKFVEEFAGCASNLVYRSVTVDDADSRTRRLKGFSLNPGGANEMPVTNISERFARNPSVPADRDVRKRTYFIDQGKIELLFHYGDGRVTASSRVYSKDGGEVVGWQADPSAKPPRPSALRQEFQAQVQAEKETMSTIRARESDLNEMLNQLRVELDEGALDRSVDDKVRAKAKSDQGKLDGGGDASADVDGDASARKLDYLAPFLAQFPAGKPLTREQAEQARDECMASLTERLLKRGNIIQRRLNEEHDRLKKREASYQRNQGAHVDRDDEEFNAFYEATMFRIHILDARLHRHEKLAMKKFRALDLQLRTDPRLEIIYRTG